MVDVQIEQAALIIKDAKDLVAFSGAGMSAESGIPTFRDPGGIWDKMDPNEVATGSGLMGAIQNNPERLRSFLDDALNTFEAAEPNPGHLALATLEQMGILRSVVTQNIDDLHSQAGNTKVLEVHGNLFRFKCLRCSAKWKFKKDELIALGRKLVDYDGPIEMGSMMGLLPKCDCGFIGRPDVVMFGEAVQSLNEAFGEGSLADVCLVLGTSGVVYPAAYVPGEAKKAGAKVIEINPNENSFKSITDVYIKGKTGEILPKIMERIKH